MKNSRSLLVVFSVLVMATTLTSAACSSGSGRIADSESPGSAGEIDPGTAVAVSATSSVPGDFPPPDAKVLLESSGFTSVPGFRTDFSRSTIPVSDVLSGGPPKDGIPAVDRPIFIGIAEADEWLGEDEPVFVVSADGQTHIYPVQIITYHEIVNDVVGNTPVTLGPTETTRMRATTRADNHSSILARGLPDRSRQWTATLVLPTPFVPKLTDGS